MRRVARGQAVIHRNHPPVHPFAPVLVALVAVVTLGFAYWQFRIGRDAFAYAAATVGVSPISMMKIEGSMIAIIFLFVGLLLARVLQKCTAASP
jgi:hypothetical protein